MNLKNWHRRLSVQLVALLSLALLPLGSIALFQTNQVAVEADRFEGLALLGLTERAARAEQSAVERAVGVARLFGSVAPDLLSDVSACQPTLSRFLEANSEYSFVGVIPLSGLVECSSSPQKIDFSYYPEFEETMAAQQPTIMVNPSGPYSQTSVFVVSEPFWINGEFAGFVSVSVPHSGLPHATDRLDVFGLEELVTFNDSGSILTSRSELSEAELEMPQNLLLEGFSKKDPLTFRGVNQAGEERRYSIVPIQGSPAAVMSVWRLEESIADRERFSIPTYVFPILMWIASMSVAMLAMHTFVLRHLRRIRGKMSAFADNREVDLTENETSSAPIEIEQLEANFTRMSRDILRDEATLEDALREKSVLIKEIHHRVKNNLQLISSIMNMQIRQANNEETKTTLRRLQDRVLSLATIHRNLYESQDAGRIDAGSLVNEIVGKSVEMVEVEGQEIDVTVNTDPILLYPDQAVPLSMMVAESVTNALKNIGSRGDGKPFIKVNLSEENGQCTLVMINSIGADTSSEGTGLGHQLMNAFAMQIGGQISTQSTDDHYTLTLSFKALEFQPASRDF